MLRFIAPMFSLILLLVGSGFFMTYITIRLNLIADNKYIIFLLGGIHAAYYSGLILGALTLEKFIVRVGHIRAFATFASLLAITIVIQGLFIIPFIWIALRFIAGMSFAALYIVIESWLLSESSEVTRGKVLALYMGGIYCSQAAGNLFTGIVKIDTLTPFLLAAGFCTAAVIPVAITKRPSPTIHEITHLKLSYCIKKSRFGFFGCLAAGLIISSIYSFLPDVAIDNQLSTATMMSLTIVGGFLLQWPIGLLSDIFPRRKMLIAVSAILTIPCAIAFFSTHLPWLHYSLCFVIGSLSFVIYPISIAKVCDMLEQNQILSATSALLVVYGVGAALGPILVSTFVHLFNSSYIFVYISLIAACLAIFGFYTLQQVDGPETDSSEFIAMANVTPIANELDPRSDPIKE